MSQPLACEPFRLPFQRTAADERKEKVSAVNDLRRAKNSRSDRGAKQESIKGLKIIPRRVFCDAGQFAGGDNLSGRLCRMRSSLTKKEALDHRALL